jgi:hypothetical protein
MSGQIHRAFAPSTFHRTACSLAPIVLAIGAAASAATNTREDEAGQHEIEVEVGADPDEESGAELEADPDEPATVGQSFRISAGIAGGGYAEFLIDCTLPTIQLSLAGLGTSDLNFVVVDDELGMIAVAASPRDRERLQIANDYPRTLRVIVLNAGRNANLFTLSGY